MYAVSVYNEVVDCESITKKILDHINDKDGKKNFRFKKNKLGSEEDIQVLAFFSILFF